MTDKKLLQTIQEEQSVSSRDEILEVERQFAAAVPQSIQLGGESSDEEDFKLATTAAPVVIPA